MCWFGIPNLAIHSQMTECHSENSTLGQAGWQHHSYTNLAAFLSLREASYLRYFSYLIHRNWDRMFHQRLWLDGFLMGCRGISKKRSWRKGSRRRCSGWGLSLVLVPGKKSEKANWQKKKTTWVCEAWNYLYPLILSDLKNYLDGLGSSVIQTWKLLKLSLPQSVSPPFCLYQAF